MEKNTEKEELLSELEEVLISANFELSQIQSILNIHQSLSIKEIQESLQKYKDHKDNYNRTVEIVDTYNRVAEEGMAKFQERAIDIVDEVVREELERDGIDYEPDPNPYRQNKKDEDHNE